jgi:hypothetical protein
LIKEKFGLDEGDAYTMSKSGVPLSDGTKTIKAAGIKSGETILIDYAEITIKVKKASGTVFDIKVDPDNKVDTIRYKI